jgi:hypothetical protein
LSFNDGVREGGIVEKQRSLLARAKGSFLPD